MAISKKGTRLINVDGKTYRWFANVDYDYCYKFFVITSVEDDRYQVTSAISYDRDFVISPRLIREAILQAHERGWKPGISNPKTMVLDSYAIISAEPS
jgi:hypothetical protein